MGNVRTGRVLSALVSGFAVLMLLACGKAQQPTHSSTAESAPTVSAFQPDLHSSDPQIRANNVAQSAASAAEDARRRLLLLRESRKDIQP